MGAPFVILSAVAAGLLAGRKALGREIHGRKNKAIEAAAVETRHRIRADALMFVTRSFRNFAVATAIKLSVLSSIWAAHHFGLIGRPVFLGLASAALVLFLMRDVWVNFPVARVGLAELRRHGWHPKRALTGSIAARVFAEVLAGANAQPQSRTSNVMLALAGENRDRMHEEIATAVAEVARQTSWDDIRPYVLSAAIRMGALALLYSASVWVLMRVA